MKDQAVAKKDMLIQMDSDEEGMDLGKPLEDQLADLQKRENMLSPDITYAGLIAWARIIGRNGATALFVETLVKEKGPQGRTTEIRMAANTE